MNANKQLKQILFPMVKSVLHFLKIHGKMVFGNTSVVVQNMFGKTPESLNAVNVVFSAPVNESFTMTDGMVFAQSFEGIVAPEGVGVVDRSLSCLLLNDSHKLFFGNMLHHSRVYLAIALQKAKYNVFTLGSSVSHTLLSAAKIAFVHLHFTIELAALKLGHMVDCLAELLIQSGNRLVIEAEVMRKSVGWLLLVETLDNGNFSANLPQRLLFSTGLVPATNVSASRPRHLKRTAENTLFTPQKVGYATKNILSPLYHMDILISYGYETH